MMTHCSSTTSLRLGNFVASNDASVISGLALSGQLCGCSDDALLANDQASSGWFCG